MDVVLIKQVAFAPQTNSVASQGGGEREIQGIGWSDGFSEDSNRCKVYKHNIFFVQKRGI